MDAEAKAAVAMLKGRRATANEQRAAMQEVFSEIRQAILNQGIDAHLLREFELFAVDLALNVLVLSNMDAQIDNVESAVQD
jgi:hypothetical protein